MKPLWQNQARDRAAVLKELTPNPKQLQDAIYGKLPPAGTPEPPKPKIDSNEAPSDFTTGQIQLNALKSTLIVGNRPGRAGVKITNLSSIDIYILPVTQQFVASPSSTGDLLPGTRGAWIWIPVRAAIFGIAASGTPLVSFLEIFEVA